MSQKTLLERSLRVATRISLAVSTYFLLTAVVPLAFNPNGSSFKKNLIKDVAPYTLPMQFIDGQRFCSSSAVSFMGKVYTVTNKHCCEADSFMDNLRLVGNSIEEILHISPDHDLCILSSKFESSPITVAMSDVELFDEILMMGYPRGGDLTPRYGHVLRTNYVQYLGPEYNIAHKVSTITYGGNSGSPILNTRGEIVGVFYAGNMLIHTYGIIVPHRYLVKALMETHFE